MHIKADHRKINTLLFFGIIIFGSGFLVLNSDSYATGIVWTPLLLGLGSAVIVIACLYRYIIKIDNREILISSRFGLRTKRISLDEISRVKVLDREFPIGIYGDNLVSLFFADKKFNRYKQILLLNEWGEEIFIVDGQSIDNSDFATLVNYFKR